MKIQDTDGIGVPSPRGRAKGKRWLAGMGAIVVVVLVVGFSALLFAQLRQQQAGQVTATPVSGQWKQVLQGYSVSSIVAARSNPAMLYACATHVSAAASQGGQGSATVLRSNDFGDHWQDIGSKASIGGTCQMAVNPTDGNEIYVVSTTNNSQFPVLLKHSSDGGQTWETIQPVLHIPGTQQPTLWYVQQMQLEGNRLFGLQWIMSKAHPVDQPIRAVPFLLPRLITSSDGGHNWTAIDSQFAPRNLGVHSYAVDPTNPNTIYALVGGIRLPVEQTIPSGALPPTGLQQELYKTTDGGTTWQSLLNNILYGSQVQLASGKPQVIYVGGTIGPIPLNPALRGGAIYPAARGSFSLQSSANGGATWRTVTIPPDMQSIQDWYVSAGGQVYASPTMPVSGQPTAVVGTVVPATPVPSPTRSSQYAELPQQQGVPPSTPTQVPAALSHFIQRYDPMSNAWSDVTRPPTAGFTLQVTPAQATSGAILWFSGMVNGRESLYRYAV